MALVMPWGGTYSLIAELGLPQNVFTLDNASLGVLGGNCYLDGRANDDLTDRVLDISISRGRHDQFQDFQSSTMSIKLSNNDRELDPVNQSSRYWDPVTESSGVTIRRRVTLYYGTTAVFSGVITDIDISYDPASSMITQSTVDISVADDFVVLANTYLDEVLPTSQLSGARINAILDLPEVDYQGAVDIDAGTVICLDDPIAFGTRTLDALQQVAATERGYLFMRGDGTLRFTDRVVGSPTILKLFSDDETGTKYSTLSIVYGQENLYNRVTCTPIDSVNPGLAENAASISTFGVSALSLNNLLFSDADAQDLADYMLSLYQLPSYRFDGMTIIFAGNQVSLADQAAIIALDLGDTVRINKTFAIGSPSQIYQNVAIEHVDHKISPTAHQITFKFSPAQFATFTKSATGSGSSSQTAIGLHIADRTAVGAGSATAGDSAVGLHIAPRTATGTGVGTETAVGLRSALRSATGAGSATAGDTAIGLHIAPRTATGSGTGSSTSDEVLTAIRTATGSGTGSETAVGVRVVERSATGSGAGTEDAIASFFSTFTVTATGSGTGTETASGTKVVMKTASGSGTGTQTTTETVVFVLILDDATRGLLNTSTLGY